MRQRANELVNARLNYQQWGDSGPRVLLLHPIGFDRHTWGHVAAALARDCRVVAPDLPGHGESDKPATADYGLRSMGARIVRFLDELGWEDAILVGNSIGGGTALSATVQAPERVRGLALLNAVGYRWGLPPVGLLAYLPFVPFLGGYSPRLAMRLGLDYARCGWGKVSQERFDLCYSYMRDPTGRVAFFRMLRQLYGPDLGRVARHYREIRCPTLVLHGEYDPLIRRWHARRLAAAIPHAELAWLPRCGHFPQEECPEAVLKQLHPFIRRVHERAAPAPARSSP